MGMAKNEQKVMEFVEKELNSNPEQSTTELFEKAKKVDTGVAKLSLRQFNARFPLQIKRRKSLAAPNRRRTARRSPTRRSRQKQEEQQGAMREVFLRFATDLTAAEERKDLVGVLAKVDSYVADALKVSGR